jgi:hypothetical protein
MRYSGSSLISYSCTAVSPPSLGAWHSAAGHATPEGQNNAAGHLRLGIRTRAPTGPKDPHSPSSAATCLGPLVLADGGGQARRSASGNPQTLGRDWALCLAWGSARWSGNGARTESSLERGRSSVCGTGRQAAIVKNRLKRIQYGPGLSTVPRPDRTHPRTPAPVKRYECWPFNFCISGTDRQTRQESLTATIADRARGCLSSGNCLTRPVTRRRVHGRTVSPADCPGQVASPTAPGG